MARQGARGARPAKGNGPDQPPETILWDAADKMRGNLEASEYKHIVLGLVFLKYISDIVSSALGG